MAFGAWAARSITYLDRWCIQSDNVEIAKHREKDYLMRLLVRFCKLESAFVVSFVAVKPTEWVVFGVLVFQCFECFKSEKVGVHHSKT